MNQNEDRKEAMRKIKDEVMDLKSSPLCEFRIQNKNFPVIGEGSHFAKIMFVGEAPGKNEAATGRPFCGASGRILDELLLSVGIVRGDVYVTNIVKDRPPENRDPLPQEIEVYSSFLDRQIDIIKPKVIAGLGRYSSEYLMRKFGLESKLEPISKMHGKVFDTKTNYGLIKIIPFFHPAVAVYNSKTKDTLKADFLALRDFVGD
jgi:uracil-DNA glycosylase